MVNRVSTRFESLYDFYVGGRPCERGYTYDELCSDSIEHISEEGAADDLLPVSRTEKGYIAEDQTLRTLAKNRVFRRNVIDGINTVLDYYGIVPDGNSLKMADDFDLKASRWQESGTGHVIGQLVACSEFYGMHTLSEKIYRFARARRNEGMTSISKKEMKLIKRSRPETVMHKIISAMLSAVVAVLAVIAVALMIYVGTIAAGMNW